MGKADIVNMFSEPNINCEIIYGAISKKGIVCLKLSRSGVLRV